MALNAFSRAQQSAMQGWIAGMGTLSSEHCVSIALARVRDFFVSPYGPRGYALKVRFQFSHSDKSRVQAMRMLGLCRNNGAGRNSERTKPPVLLASFANGSSNGVRFMAVLPGSSFMARHCLPAVSSGMAHGLQRPASLPFDSYLIVSTAVCPCECAAVLEHESQIPWSRGVSSPAALWP